MNYVAIESHPYLLRGEDIGTSIQNRPRGILTLRIHLEVLVLAVVSSSNDEHNYVFIEQLRAIARHQRSSGRRIVIAVRLCERRHTT